MYGKIKKLLVAADASSTGSVSLDVELLIRLLEWAREEAKADVPLHFTAERLEAVCRDGKVATMADYADIVPNDPEQTSTSSVGDTELLKVEFRGDFDWLGFVSALAVLGDIGSSRPVAVAPGDADIERELSAKGCKSTFNFDGDGSDKVMSAELNGREFWPPWG
jgi:hypothetical protein